LEKNYDDRTMTIGRVAVLTKEHNGRQPCHYCGPCERGCSTGSYFSTQSATLPVALATGNLTVKTDSIAEKVLYNAQTNRASGVRVIDEKPVKQRNIRRARFSFARRLWAPHSYCSIPPTNISLRDWATPV